MLIGVPKEIKNHEYRVGLTPAGTRELVTHGHEVMVQKNAGAAIGLSDAMYRNAGASIIDTAEDIFARAAEHAPYRMAVDLETCRITDEHGLALDFEVQPFRRHCLLNGLDDIALILEHEAKITEYEESHGIVAG